MRFFRERRIEVSFVDLAKRSIASGELRRFTQRFGAAAVADPQSRPYQAGGFAWLTLDDEQWVQRLLSEPRLLRLPLVRAGSRIAVGDDEPTWRELLAEAV